MIEERDCNLWFKQGWEYLISHSLTLWESIMKLINLLSQGIKYLSEAIGRIFAPNDDHYPATGMVPFWVILTINPSGLISRYRTQEWY